MNSLYAPLLEHRHDVDGIGDIPDMGTIIPDLGMPKGGMEVSREIYAARAAAQAPSRASIPALLAPQCNDIIPLREELYELLIELALDLRDPERYGHAVPSEVVVRAARLVKMTEAERRR